MTQAKEEFDTDYRIVRKTLMAGRTDVATARLWLRRRAKRVEMLIAKEKMEHFYKRVLKNPDQELSEIQKYMEEMKRENPLDDDKDEDDE